MARDNAPIPHTCPIIDEIISAIESIEWNDTYWTKKDLIESMEKIRKANDTLRTWGNELFLDFEKLENESQSNYIELENENEDLKSEIESLKLEILNFENENEDLKSEIKSLKLENPKIESELYNVTSQ